MDETARMESIKTKLDEISTREITKETDSVISILNATANFRLDFITEEAVCEMFDAFSLVFAKWLSDNDLAVDNKNMLKCWESFVEHAGDIVDDLGKYIFTK